jgi:UDP-N-acetylglucosamine transferase subunit ALG13
VIFVTIGSMFPFDRLIRVMDAWALANPAQDVLAQIGDGSFEPQHMKFVRRLSQTDFGETVARAALIVSHAGMGTVITAGREGRPMVLLPRLQEWGEHTTDHQIATANWLGGKPGIHVAQTDADLPTAIVAALTEQGTGPRIAPVADPAFTDRLRAAIRSFNNSVKEVSVP